MWQFPLLSKDSSLGNLHLVLAWCQTNTWIQLNSHRHAGIQQQGELLTKYFIPFLFKQTVNNFFHK